jgi:Cys-rich repeat protein
MDSGRFDQVAKDLAGGLIRRGILKGLFGGAVVATAGGIAPEPVGATTGSCEASTEPRTTVGDYCNAGGGRGHQCSETAHLVCDLSKAVLFDSYCSSVGGSCQCVVGYFQSANGVCIPNGTCDVDTDCEIGLVCDDVDHSCVECASDSHCLSPDSPVCDATSCTCVECALNDDCESDQVCDPLSNTCVQCVEGSDCFDAAPFCDSTNRTCVACVSDENCGEDVCNPATGTCVECVNNTDCPAEQPNCAGDNTCQQCLSDANCAGDTPICDIAVGVCVECMEDVDCEVGTICNGSLQVC